MTLRVVMAGLIGHPIIVMAGLTGHLIIVMADLTGHLITRKVYENLVERIR